MTAVLWITPGYPWPEQPVGGIFHRTQARALASLGVKVTVAAPVPRAPWPLSLMSARWALYARAPRATEDAGVRVIRPRYLNVPGQPPWARADQLIARSVWRSRDAWAGASVIHGHAAVEGLAAWHLAQRTGLPYVLTFHGSDINTWPASHPGQVEDLRSAVREAAVVFAVSGALADRVRDLTGVAAVALPLGSDHGYLEAHRVDRGTARRDLRIPDNQILALFVGHLLRAKGVHEFVDAIRAVGSPFMGILVGDGPEAGYGLADAAGESSLRYTGELSHEQAVRYMSAADVLVLPSYNEGLPTVLVEAGSLGLPVIATPVGGVPELLGVDRGTMLPKPGASALVEALKSFAADRSAAVAAAVRLQAHVRAEYDVYTNAEGLLAWYRTASTVRSAR